MPIRSAYLTYGIHLLVWGSLVFIPLIFVHNAVDSTGLPGYFFFFANIYHIALFYINAYFLYPRFFTKKLWWLYLLILAAIMALSYYAKLYLLNRFYPAMVLTDYNNRIIF